MGRPRRRATLAILAFLALTLASMAGMGRDAARAEASGVSAMPCHDVAEPTPTSPALPCSETPCQLALPLLCCAQPAAADASVSHPSPPKLLGAHHCSGDLLLRRYVLRTPTTVGSITIDPPRERSVVLQV